MKVFNHVFNTWALAHFLHPIIFHCYFSFVLHDTLSIGALVSLFVGAFIISSPSLFICFFLIRLLLRTKAPLPYAFIIWIFLALTSILINLFFLNLLLGTNFNQTDWKFFIPSFAAVLGSILLRFKFFEELIQNQTSEEQDNISSSYGSESNNTF
jgi:hypothetical protein